MLNNHHDIDQNISFLGKYFFSLVTHFYLYQKQLNQHTNKSLVHLLLFHLIEEDFVNQIWNYCISNRFQDLLLWNQSMVISMPLAFLAAAIPLSLSILGYMFPISNETKIVLSGILSEFNSSIISSKWLVSLILVSILLVSGAQTTSIKRDKFSMAVLHPVVKRRAGLFGLWVVYSVLLFPGTAFLLTIYLAYSLLISFLDIHLVVHSFTLLICNVVGS